MALEFLGDGEWTVGSGPENDVQLLSGPERWGSLSLEFPAVWFQPADSADVRIGDELISERVAW